jgi:hypothetical protein
MLVYKLVGSSRRVSLCGFTTRFLNVVTAPKLGVVLLLLPMKPRDTKSAFLVSLPKKAGVTFRRSDWRTWHFRNRVRCKVANKGTLRVHKTVKVVEGFGRDTSNIEALKKQG